MDDALLTYLKPETLERLQTLARTSKPAANYLKGLEACAFLLKQAETFDQLPEHPAPGQIDNLFDAMAQHINAAIGDLANLGSLIDELNGYTFEPLLQRKKHIAERGKSALLERIVSHQAHR